MTANKTSLESAAVAAETTRPFWILLLGMAFASAAAIAVLVGSFAGPLPGFLTLAACHLVFGVLIFALHGGPLITPTGLYYLSTAVFVGGASLYVPTVDSRWDLFYELSAAIFAANLLLFMVRFRHELRGSSHIVSRSTTTARSLGFARRLGLVLLGLGMFTHLAGLEVLGPIPHALAFSGVVSLLVGAGASIVGRKRSIIIGLMVAAMGLMLFIDVFFSGMGRLHLVALALAAGMVVNILGPRRWHKWAVVGLVIPAWLAAGLIGVERGPTPQPATTQEILVEGEGLSSGYGGLVTFADLIELDRTNPHEAFPRQYGLTLVEGLTAPFPRVFWPDKPFGFGFNLTLLLLPKNAATGHSMVATAFGEWYVNFWWIGFLVIPLVVALLLRLTDDWLQRRNQLGITNEADVFSLVVLIIVVASIPNYIWGSLFSVVARAGIRVLLLLPLWLGARWLIDLKSTTTVS